MRRVYPLAPGIRGSADAAVLSAAVPKSSREPSASIADGATPSRVDSWQYCGSRESRLTWQCQAREAHSDSPRWEDSKRLSCPRPE